LLFFKQKLLILILDQDEKEAVWGVTFSNKTKLQEQMRCALNNLRDFGFGKI